MDIDWKKIKASATDINWRKVKTAAAFFTFKETTGLAAGSVVVGAADPTPSTAHASLASKVEAIAVASPMKVIDGSLETAKQVGQNLLQDFPTLQMSGKDGGARLAFSRGVTSLGAQVPAGDARMALYGAISVGTSLLAVKALHKVTDARRNSKASESLEVKELADVEKPAASRTPPKIRPQSKLDIVRS